MPARASIALLLSLFCFNSHAEMFFSDFSLTYLNGSHYQLGDNQREVITLEHASAFSWGDNFFFLDRLKSANGNYETYFELGPRFNLPALNRALPESGLVQLLLATTLESGHARGKRFNNLLYGLGMSLNLPGFNYFNLNLYRADNDLWDNDEQLTLSWGYPFTIAGQKLLYDGFLDWSSASRSNAAEMNFTSQLKWQLPLDHVWGDRVYLGLEYACWNNKYGVAGINERNPSILLKWHF